jgi:hypothetical protein
LSGHQYQKSTPPPPPPPLTTTTTTTRTIKNNVLNANIEFRERTQILSQNYPNFYQQPAQQQQQQQPSQTVFPQYSQYPYSSLYPFNSSTFYQQPMTSIYSTPNSLSSTSVIQQQPGQNLGAAYWTNSQYSEWGR